MVRAIVPGSLETERDVREFLVISSRGEERFRSDTLSGVNNLFAYPSFIIRHPSLIFRDLLSTMPWEGAPRGMLCS